MGSIPYLVTDLATGDPLTQRLGRGPLSEAQTLELGVQLSAALAAVHASGLVHGAVCPDNILFDSDGSHVSLVDWGITVDFPTDAFTAGMEERRRYTAPERFAGDHRIDGRADLFSLGCVLYECLTGKPPFTELDLRNLLRQHLKAPIPSLAEVVPHAEPQVCGLVHRLLASDPEDRYPSAAALNADLEQLLRGEEPSPPPSPPPIWRYGAEPWCAPNPKILGRGLELSLLGDAWRDVVESHSRVVVLTGSAGAGKTLLVHDFLGSLDGDHATILTATCEYADPKPFSAVRQLIEEYVHVQRHASHEAIDEADNHLRALAGDFAPLLRVLSPRLAEVFRDARPVPAAEETHKVFIEGVAEFLSRALRQLGPMVAFVDNAHWLDTGSRRVLARVAGHLATSQALLPER